MDNWHQCTQMMEQCDVESLWKRPIEDSVLFDWLWRKEDEMKDINNRSENQNDDLMDYFTFRWQPT